MEKKTKKKKLYIEILIKPFSQLYEESTKSERISYWCFLLFGVFVAIFMLSIGNW